MKGHQYSMPRRQGDQCDDDYFPLTLEDVVILLQSARIEKRGTAIPSIQVRLEQGIPGKRYYSGPDEEAIQDVIRAIDDLYLLFIKRPLIPIYEMAVLLHWVMQRGGPRT